MARKRKHGPRTKSGRLSRAYKRNPELRDQGTPENRAKRAYTINGADPQLAASASGILLANGFLTQAQHTAALRYARLHSIVFGKAWSYACPLSWELGHQGSEPSEELIRRARDRLDVLNARLDPDQRQAVANVCVFGFVPMWFYVARGIGRAIKQDERERRALVSGLDALGAHYRSQRERLKRPLAGGACERRAVESNRDPR